MMSRHGLCPTHNNPNLPGGAGCYLCRQDDERRAHVIRLEATVERLQETVARLEAELLAARPGGER